MRCRICSKLAKAGNLDSFIQHLAEKHRIIDNYNVECLCGEALYLGPGHGDALVKSHLLHRCTHTHSKALAVALALGERIQSAPEGMER